MSDPTNYVPHVIEETWRIEQFYWQAAALTKGATFLASSARKKFENCVDRVKHASMQYELDRQNPSTEKNSGKWILSLHFTAAKQWQLNLKRKSKQIMGEPMIVQVEMKILTGGHVYKKEPTIGPFWIPSTQKINASKVIPELGSCHYCRRQKMSCSCGRAETTCTSCCFKCNTTLMDAQELTEVTIRSWSIGSASEVRNLYLANDGSLTIYVRLEQLERSDHSARKALSVTKVVGEKEVISDLGTLFTSGFEADVNVKVVGDEGETMKTFKAHRCILAARSPVLQRMFATEMTEKLTGELVIEDISADAMEVILKYIYKGSLDLDETEMDSKETLVHELLYAAEKWELNTLKELIAIQLISWCNTDNAMELLEIATDHKIATAIEHIEGYIENNIRDILAVKRRRVE